MKRKKKLISAVLCCAVILCCALPVNATGNLNRYGIHIYNDTNGIPTGEANAVLQSSDGFIWVGGYGGLLRYDAHTFENMSGDATGMTSFSIRSLWESPSGVLWVGTNDQGPFYYENGLFHRILAPEASRFLSVRCFTSDSDGRIWMGTGDGLAYLEGDSLVSPTGDALKGQTVYTLSYDTRNMLWCVDSSGALIGISPKSGQLLCRYDMEQLGRPGETAYSCLAASDGTVYVGTNSHTVLQLTFAGGLLSLPQVAVLDTGGLGGINDIYETASGSIWMCGDTGIGMIEYGVYSDLSYLDRTDFLLCITEDYEGSIWAASSKHGLLQVTRNRILTLLPRQNLLSDSEVYATCWASNHLYVGYKAGLAVLDGSWAPVENKLTKTLAGIPVHTICQDSQNRVWFGTFCNGFFVFDPDSGLIRHGEASGAKIRMILILQDGTAAIASDGGLDIFSPDLTLLASYGEGSVMTNRSVLCMTQLRDGTLLAGTDGGGIYALSGQELMPYANKSSGLSGLIILRIAQDDISDNVWVSCGYDLFFGNSADGFTKTAEMTQGSGSVLDIIPDSRTIWLSRSSGVLQLNRTDLLEKDSITGTFYGREDGLPATLASGAWNYYNHAFFIFCTTGGIAILNVKNNFSVTAAPKAAIKALVSSNGETWNGEKVFHVSPGARKLTFSLAGLTYTSTNATVEYWLEGFDKEPIIRPVASLSSIEYTNIPAGTYVFHLRTANGEKLQSEESTVTIVKAPLLTETFWFWAMIFLALSLLVLVAIHLITRLRTSMLEKQQQQYKKITDQALDAISSTIDAKDPYTSGHSRRVAEFSVRIAQAMELSRQDCENLFYIALLHDIGKIGIPDQILKKESPLTQEEFEIVRQHPEIGGAILEHFSALQGVADGARFHHERYDGKGYCQGRRGDEIPLFARIIGIADAIDAMRSDRCYQRALTLQQVMEELKKGSGTQFDPAIAAVAYRLLESDLKHKRKA